MCRKELSVRQQTETDCRNAYMSDEIDYIEEIHCIEKDCQDIPECFQSVSIDCTTTECTFSVIIRKCQPRIKET